jgi:hypothetical protein
MWLKVIDKPFVADEAEEAHAGVTQDDTTGTPLSEIHVPPRVRRAM